MKGCSILSKAFSASIKRIWGFCPCFYLYDIICFWIYVCWNILASLEWNQLGHGVWSFSCVDSVCQCFLENLWIYIY
jgi:hypothetical protein